MRPAQWSKADRNGVCRHQTYFVTQPFMPDGTWGPVRFGGVCVNCKHVGRIACEESAPASAAR